MTDQAPPRPQSEDDLEFKRMPMVGWFNPAQLLRIAMQAYNTAGVISLVDEREIQALLAAPKEKPHDYSAKPELWFDFVADLGDGFDSTYSVAWALAQKSLTVAGAPPLPRGEVLIMGGDEVYPAASRDNYENRLVGPYRAALPYANPPLDLFAIPGNHDWYDGLVSFLRLFCQPTWIGGWRTSQTRSYFVLKLPHGWWLWATDIQLERDIDRPQMEFFMDASSKLAKGDRVILCTAEPSWIQSAFGSTRPYKSLSFIERSLIEQREATLAVTLTGDRHNYARFEAADGSKKQKINAGGGGAFLSGTHDLPPSIELPKGDRATERFDRTSVYPDVGASRSGVWRTMAFVWWNKWFGLVLALLYMTFGFVVQSASRRDLLLWPRQLYRNLDPIPVDSLQNWLRTAGATFMEIAEREPAAQVMKALLGVLVRSPAVLTFALVVIGGLVGFALASRRKQATRDQVLALAFGAVHGALHLGLGIALLVVLTKLNARVFGLSMASATAQLVLTLEMAVFGTIVGGVLMAAYLIISNLVAGLHDQEVYSAQANPNCKNFLRLFIDSTGTLTIYPLGIDKAGSWTLDPTAASDAPWFKSSGDPRAIHLIEPPVSYPPAPGSGS